MNRVGQLRQRRGLTVEQLAQLVGCSSVQIRNIERGHNNPGIILARKVASALSAPLDEVFPPDSLRTSEAR